MGDFIQIIAKYKKVWETQFQFKSGNSFSNALFPKKYINKIFRKNQKTYHISQKLISIQPFDCAIIENSLKAINGINILNALQNLYLANHLSLYRVIRYPTVDRIYDTIKKNGLSTLNYEQDRLLTFYNDSSYIKSREDITKDSRFWVIPQERIVNGLPVFFYANDAINIHRCFRRKRDLILVVAAFIPKELLFNKTLKIYSNRPFTKNYFDATADRLIEDYCHNNDERILHDQELLHIKGIDPYETYIKGLPHTISKCNSIGIKQRYFLIEIKKVTVDNKKYFINGIKISSEIMKKYPNVFSSIWGDDDLFSRRKTDYLPINCFELFKAGK